MWGIEVSWEIKPLAEGTKGTLLVLSFLRKHLAIVSHILDSALADGGSPMSCEFSVAGAVCERTCEGKVSLLVLLHEPFV